MSHNISRSYDSFSIEYTIVVQQEDGGVWTHGTVVERDDNNHSNRSYMIRITKTGQEVIIKTHKSNTYNNQTIPQGPANQKHSSQPSEGYTKAL